MHADAHVYELEGKRILAFHIHELNRRQKPLYLNGNPWQAYIRRGARDEKVTDHELQRFLRDSAPRPWDSDTRPDIDPATVRRYSDYHTLLTNNAFSKIEAYGLLDASFNYAWGERYLASVFARNLTDEDYFTHAFAVPVNEALWNFATPREPRIWGVEFRATF